MHESIQFYHELSLESDFWQKTQNIDFVGCFTSVHREDSAHGRQENTLYTFRTSASAPSTHSTKQQFMKQANNVNEIALAQNQVT